jgi:N-dimethylarginine dimethylaminohydrolase
MAGMKMRSDGGSKGSHVPSEVRAIQELLLKHPREAWRDETSVRGQWENLGYRSEPDFERACAEYDALVVILRRYATDVRFLPSDPRTGLDSIYVRDAACESPRGLVIGRMGKAARRGEPEAVRDFCLSAGWPVAGEIREPGTLEGGDVVWLDAQTAAVGHGYRTNGEGIRQFRDVVAVDGCEVLEVPLPHWDGPGDVLHLMSMLSPVGPRTLLVYSRLLPIPFRNRLRERGFELLEVPDDEYGTMAANVLALAPGVCLALAGNPGTARTIEKAGLGVITYEGEEISLKGAGGPTCLTRPLRRAA